jgi:hypothetical protein
VLASVAQRVGEREPAARLKFPVTGALVLADQVPEPAEV